MEGRGAFVPASDRQDRLAKDIAPGSGIFLACFAVLLAAPAQRKVRGRPAALIDCSSAFGHDHPARGRCTGRLRGLETMRARRR